jgi:hypothetical protein
LGWAKKKGSREEWERSKWKVDRNGVEEKGK